MIRIALLLAVACGAGLTWHFSAPGAGKAMAFVASLRPVATVAAARAAAPQPMADPVAVTTAAAATKALPITRSAVGWIEPASRVTIRARMDGAIVERHVRDGAAVEAGDLLFRLDDRELKAQIARSEATLARDRAVLVKAQADSKRALELLSRGAGTQAQFDQATAAVSIAAAEVAASEATLEIERARLTRTTITAPISGRVGVVNANEGDLVRGSDLAGDGLVTIVQAAPLLVSFAMPERDLPLLRATLADPYLKEEVHVAAGKDGAQSAHAELSFIDSAVDTASGTILVKATLARSDAFWPGEYVRVDLTLGTRPEATAVPLVALQSRQGGSHVFVVGPNATAALRRVEPIDTSGDVALIGRGLRVGERVVVEGHHRLQDGSPVFERLAAAAALVRPPGGPAAGRVQQ